MSDEDPLEDIVQPKVRKNPNLTRISPFVGDKEIGDVTEVLGGKDDEITAEVIRRRKREQEHDDAERAAASLHEDELPEERPKQQLNGWTDTIQLIANDIAQKTLMLKEIHGRAYRTFSRRANRFGLLLIGVSSIASILTVFPSGPSPWDPFSIFSKIFTYLVTGLTFLNKFLKYDQKAEQHREAEGKFLEFYHSIQSQLLLDDWTKREEGSAFLGFVFKTFPNIIKEAPDPPSKIVAATRAKVETGVPVGEEPKDKKTVVEAGDEKDLTLGVTPGQIPLTIITRTTSDTRWEFDVNPLTRYRLSKFQTGQGL